MSALLENFSALAFDFDGTLADSISLYEPARIQACAIRAEETGDERYLSIPLRVHREGFRQGSGSYEITEWVLAQAGIVVQGESRSVKADPVAEVLDIRREVYRQMIRDGLLKAIPGAPEAVRQSAAILPGRLAIVTTANYEQEVAPFLNAQDIADIFDENLIIDGNDVKQSELKPHPAAYNLAIERFSLQNHPMKMIAIEDLPKGIEAVNRAGSYSIALATSHSIMEWMRHEGVTRPDLIVDDFATFGEVMLAGVTEPAAI